MTQRGKKNPETQSNKNKWTNYISKEFHKHSEGENRTKYWSKKFIDLAFEYTGHWETVNGKNN